MTKLLLISLCFLRFMKLKVTVFSRLHKWGIANDPAVEAERFTEACFVERFGRKRQTRPKTFLPHEIAQRYLFGVPSVAKKQSLLALPAPLFRVPYTLRGSFGIFTTVERALQIRPFLTNKPNFRKTQMNVTKVLTRVYVNQALSEHGKNKANSNPIQTQFKANTKPIRTQFKPKRTQNEPNFRGKKCFRV